MYLSLYFFLCQAPRAAASAPCGRKGWEWWHTSCPRLCCAGRGRGARGAVAAPRCCLGQTSWHTALFLHWCCASASPSSGVYTALSYQGLSPDKSIQQWSRKSRTYLVHSSLARSGCRCGSKHSYHQTGSKGIHYEGVITTILWAWQWQGLMR